MVQFSTAGTVVFITLSIIQVLVYALLIGKFFHTNPFKKIYDYLKELGDGLPFYVYTIITTITYNIMLIGYLCSSRGVATFGMFFTIVSNAVLAFILIIFVILNIAKWLKRLHNYIGERKGQ